MEKDQKAEAVLRSLRKPGPACIAQASENDLHSYREIVWPSKKGKIFSNDHTTVKGRRQEVLLRYFSKETIRHLKDHLLDEILALYSLKGSRRVIYLDDDRYRWDIRKNPSFSRTLYGIDSEERLFHEPVLLELPNAMGTMYYRVAVHKHTVKATLNAIYEFYKDYERDGYTMGNVTLIQRL